MFVYFLVEKKHLELVPHEMTEEDFWRKFLESHYIHYRDRSAEAGANPLDPCEKMDEEGWNLEFYILWIYVFGHFLQ